MDVRDRPGGGQGSSRWCSAWTSCAVRPGPQQRSVPHAHPRDRGVIAVDYVEFASIPDVGRRSAAADDSGRRAGHEAAVRQHDARHALHRQLRRQDRDAVSRHQRSEMGVGVQSGEHRAGLPELRVPSAVRRSGRARLRQVLHLRRHHQHDADARFHAAPAAPRTHDTVLLEWTAKNPARRGLRRRRAARAVPLRASVRQSQRRPDRVQSAGARPGTPISACSTSASPTAAAAAIR